MRNILNGRKRMEKYYPLNLFPVEIPNCGEKTLPKGKKKFKENVKHQHLGSNIIIGIDTPCLYDFFFL
jgi:hypothetical protein